MRSDVTARACVLGLVVVLASSSALVLAQPATAPAASASWWELLATSKNVDDVVKAREGLIKDYEFAVTQNRGFAYAEEAAKKCGPALAADDALAPLRHVNAAMALMRMTQVSIQPALDAMVQHRNAAVRYMGWRGYVGTRMLLLAGGPRYGQQMIAALEGRIAKETSPVVMTALLEMAVYPQQAPAQVSQQALTDAQDKSFAALIKGWPNAAQMVMAGDLDSLAAGRKALEAAGNYYELTSRKDAVRKDAAQVVAGMMCCATKIWKTSAPDASADDMHQQLLVEGETRLNAINSLDKSHVRTPIEKKDKDIKTALRSAALAWIDELKKLGVTEPEIEPRGAEQTVEPLTPPASQPASAPATAPAKDAGKTGKGGK